MSARTGLAVASWVALSLFPLELHAEDRRAVREAVARTAASYESVRYGAMHEGQRFDCSGLVQGVFAQHGFFLPRSSADQARVGRPVRWKELLPGDLVFFSAEPGGERITHVGIVAPDRRLVHASTSRLRVVVDKLDTEHFRARFVSARRLIGTGKPPRLALR